MASVTARDRNKNKPDKKPNWEYRFEAAKVDGKRRHISKAGFRTKKEALEAGVKALAEYNAGETPFKPSESSLNDYLQRWYDEYVMTNLRHKTQSLYNGIIKKHVVPALGHYKLNSLTPAILQGFANDLKKQGYSKRSIINILSLINGALNYAIEPLRLIKSNPMQFVKVPKIERAPRQRIVLAPENWQRIIKRFPFGNKYHIPLVIGYHTGMRISEVFALTWDDVNLKTREIRVNKQVVKIKNGDEKAKWCFGATKTKSSVRVVKIGKTLADILQKEKARQEENRARYDEFYKFHTLEQIDEKTQHFIPSPKGKVKLICVDESGDFVTTDSFKYCSRVIHHELKIEFDFHSLRHTHATILIENGANVKNVQMRLGHEKIETTLQTYVHDTDTMADQSVDIFETFVHAV